MPTAAGIDLADLPPGLRSLTMGDVERSLRDLGFWGFPRRFGVPHGGIVGSPDQFRDWWLNHWGKLVPMYAGHNAFSVDERGKVDYDRLTFQTAFGDFDNGNGSGLSSLAVREEVQKVSRWLIDHDVPHAWKCSGGDPSTENDQGYHLRVKFNEQVQPRDQLYRWENAFWRGLQHELDLRSLNIQCANPVHMERLPFTPHVHGKEPGSKGSYVADGTYCVPVPWEWIHEGKWGSIRELTLSPQVFPSVSFNGSTMPLEAFVRIMGWTTFGREPGAIHPYPDLPSMAGPAREWNATLIPDKLCLQLLPFESSPKHHTRLAWAFEVLNAKVWHPVQKEFVPIPLEEAIQLCEAVGTEAGWTDFNPRIIRQQMEQGRARNYQPYGCVKLREEGICLGARCPLFAKAFPKDYAAHIALHPEVA